MFEMSPIQPLLRLDPDLGRLLSPERLDSAERQLVACVADLPMGSCAPDHLLGERRPASVGALVLRGAIAREIRVHDAPSAELFGPGDVIRSSQWASEAQVVPAAVRWDALDPVSVALMSERTALVLRHYPEVMAVVLERLNVRAERLAVAQAISQLTGVESRIETMLWHLSERWGRVGRNGVTVTLRLSHRLLGALIGARRPTVSSAVSRLADEGRVKRTDDGTWLLLGFGPPKFASVGGTAEREHAGLAAAVAA